MEKIKKIFTLNSYGIKINGYEDHLFKNIKFLKSPNFNERPDEENINQLLFIA